MTDVSAFEGGIKVIADHLAKQRQRSINDDGVRCLYRGVNGTACGVGCLISDEAYRLTMENRPVSSLNYAQTETGEKLFAQAMTEILGHFPNVPKDQILIFLRFVQRYHDSRGGTVELGRSYVNDIATHAKFSDEQFSYSIRRHLTAVAKCFAGGCQ